MEILQVFKVSSLLNSWTGATNQTWTDDRRFTKPMLYQLSYGGTWEDCIRNACSVKKFLYNISMITIISVSDGLHHFDEAISLYTWRLGKSIEVKYIKPTKHTLASYIKKDETSKVLTSIRKLRGKVILCDERGLDYTSIAFSKKLSKLRDASEDATFIIGGAFGLDLELFDAVPHEKLRLSEFVLPHGLALLVLTEQIYRAHEILRGSGYHHE